MRTINKHEHETLKKQTDEKFGGYEIANFQVKVFSTDVVSGEQRTEKMTFKGEVFKDNDENDLFVCYDPYNDSAPQWHVYNKEELASPKVEVIEKTSIQNEENKKIALDIKHQENNLRLEEERMDAARKQFQDYQEKQELREKGAALLKKQKIKEEKLNFLNDNGYLLEITDLDEENSTLTARMTDKNGKTLATLNYTSLLSYEEIEPAEGFQVHEDDGDEFLYPYVADEDYLTIYDNKGKIIEDTGAVSIAKEAIESLKIWKQEDLEYAKDHYVDLENPETHIDFESPDSENVFRTLQKTAESPSAQRIAKLRTEYEAEKQRTRRKP